MCSCRDRCSGVVVGYARQMSGAYSNRHEKHINITNPCVGNTCDTDQYTETVMNELRGLETIGKHYWLHMQQQTSTELQRYLAG